MSILNLKYIPVEEDLKQPHKRPSPSLYPDHTLVHLSERTCIDLAFFIPNSSPPLRSINLLANPAPAIPTVARLPEGRITGDMGLMLLNILSSFPGPIVIPTGVTPPCVPENFTTAVDLVFAIFFDEFPRR